MLRAYILTVFLVTGSCYWKHRVPGRCVPLPFPQNYLKATHTVASAQQNVVKARAILCYGLLLSGKLRERRTLKTHVFAGSVILLCFTVCCENLKPAQRVVATVRPNCTVRTVVKAATVYVLRLKKKKKKDKICDLECSM